MVKHFLVITILLLAGFSYGSGLVNIKTLVKPEELKKLRTLLKSHKLKKLNLTEEQLEKLENLRDGHNLKKLNELLHVIKNSRNFESSFKKQNTEIHKKVAKHLYRKSYVTFRSRQNHKTFSDSSYLKYRSEEEKYRIRKLQEMFHLIEESGNKEDPPEELNSFQSRPISSKEKPSGAPKVTVSEIDKSKPDREKVTTSKTSLHKKNKPTLDNSNTAKKHFVALSQFVFVISSIIGTVGGIALLLLYLLLRKEQN